MGTHGSGNKQVIPPTHQALATLAQAAPVNGTWYTVLAATPMARLIHMNMMVADTGETLEFEVTIDGNTYVATQAAVANTTYYIMFNPALLTALYAGTGASQDYMAPLQWEGKNVRVRVRKTTAAGAGNLNANVLYARW